MNTKVLYLSIKYKILYTILKKYKLLDIAIALGISKTTVSKVLNNNTDVNQFTRLKVMDYVSKVGFEPNMQASSLRKKEVKTVALIYLVLKMIFLIEFKKEY